VEGNTDLVAVPEQKKKTKDIDLVPRPLSSPPCHGLVQRRYDAMREGSGRKRI
jgi:hypothetical protein